MTYMNLKKGGYYTKTGEAINMTNEQDEEKMVLYKEYNDTYGSKIFVREKKEFNKKFVKKAYEGIENGKDGK